jgi:hypothetical protein
MVLGEINRLEAERADFAVEATLSGLTYVQRLQSRQRAGYRIDIVYLELSGKTFSASTGYWPTAGRCTTILAVHHGYWSKVYEGENAGEGQSAAKLCCRDVLCVARRRMRKRRRECTVRLFMYGKTAKWL